MRDLTTAEGRLEAVHEDIAYFRAEWEKAGRPLWALGSKGVDVAHPFIRLIRNAELSAARMERLIEETRGREPKPDAPATRAELRSVPTSGAAAH